MREYNRDQLEALLMVRRHLGGLSLSEKEELKHKAESYLQFRAETADFQQQAFSDICTQKCFTSRTSACCGREGIATFFADVVINVMLSSDEDLDLLLQTLQQDWGLGRAS